MFRPLPALLVSLFSIFLLALSAQAESPPAHHPAEPGNKPAHGERMANDMGLSPEQQKAFGHAMKLHHECMKADHDFHEKVRALVNSDQYNEKTLKVMISEHHKDSEAKILAAAKAMHDFHASLSPEQKAKMEEKHKKMKERMRDHMKDRMMGPDHHPMMHEDKEGK